ncbi:hypothetical protein OA91_23470 [Marinomonas sp. SBI8L]|nr:hypothetical protein OA91_23470 [Marinomonas sp. SBI8L]
MTHETYLLNKKEMSKNAFYQNLIIRHGINTMPLFEGQNTPSPHKVHFLKNRNINMHFIPCHIKNSYLKNALKFDKSDRVTNFNK